MIVVLNTFKAADLSSQVRATLLFAANVQGPLLVTRHLSLSFSPALQLMTTVIGDELDVSTEVLTRKRWPSEVTVY